MSGFCDLQVNGYRGVDFNGDLDTTDLDRGTVQRVDRSKIRHTISAIFSFEWMEGCDGWVGLEYSYHDYQSDETFDINYNGRSDHQYSFELGGSAPLSDTAVLKGAIEYVMRDSSTGPLDTNESGDYDVFIASISIILKQ